MLSLSPLTVLPCDPVALIDAASNAGFDAVGLRLVPVLPTDVDVMSDSALRRKIARRVEASKLQVLDIEVVRVGPDTDVAGLEPLLSFAGDLGARTLAVTSLSRAEYRAVDEQRTAEKLHALAEIAGRHSIKPMIEFMIFRGIGTLEDAKRVIELADHRNLGICVDALHLQRSGGTPSCVAQTNPNMIACIQLCDGPDQSPGAEKIPYEARFDRLYPGEGQLPLRQLLASVPKTIPLSVETPCVSRAGLPVLQRAEEAARSARKLMAAAGF